MENDKHVVRQKILKEQVDNAIEAATIVKGVLQVITGNGKGKTTSAMGTALRAVGYDHKVVIAQFLKGTIDSGEIKVLQRLGVNTVIMSTGFTWETQNKEKDIQAANCVWKEAKEWLKDSSIDLVILDELTYMASYGYISLDDIAKSLKERPLMQNVIITGRHCPKLLVELADTVSDIDSVKHAFDSGIMAKPGFDY